MRLRFFLIITLIFTLTAGFLAVAQYFLSFAERIRLVDRQIEEIASAIYNTELSAGKFENVKEAADKVTDAIGDERFNTVIALFSSDGKVLYKDKNSQWIGPTFRTEPGRELIERRGHNIRLITLPPDKRGNILQVGLILDRAMTRWRGISYRILILIGLIFVGICFLSYLLSYILLRPITKLAVYLQHRATHFDTSAKLANEATPPINKGLVPFNDDELGSLVYATETLVKKVQETARGTKGRVAQMAHELKTPLTIASNSLERVQKMIPSESQEQVQNALQEIQKVARLVNHFTEWSLFENTPAVSENLYAIKPEKVVGNLVQKLGNVYPNRLKLESVASETVFANPIHFEQAVSNLVVNALEYTSDSVKVSVTREGISIGDTGNGIPKEVLNKIGTPFNSVRTERKSGTGLGLAWVSTICQKYGWSLRLESSERGTLASIVWA